MANQYFSKVNDIAASIGDLTISNNIRVGGTTIAGPIEKTLIVPVATAPPDADNLIQITAEQSGTTFLLNQSPEVANGQVLVLPPASIGLNYTFIAQVESGTGASLISIMPYGYTHADGNPTTNNGTDTNGTAEAFTFGIQAIIKVGNATGGYLPGAKSDQVCSLKGTAMVGGIAFTALAATATLKLTCVSTSIIGTALAGCRWIGTGQVALSQDIDVSA